LSVNYGEALRLYIENELGGEITEADYPESNNRISPVPLPASAWSMLALMGVGGLVAARRRRRKG
jgi:hypothetical protein